MTQPQGRRRSTFSRADIVRAIKGVQAAGLGIARVEIEPDGRIVVYAIAGQPEPLDELEAWRASRDRGMPPG